MPSFQPPIRVLMGPGPSDVHPRVLSAMARPTIGHLDPEFVNMMEETKNLLRYAFRTKNELTIPASGPGSVGMETCFPFFSSHLLDLVKVLSNIHCWMEAELLLLLPVIVQI